MGTAAIVSAVVAIRRATIDAAIASVATAIAVTVGLPVARISVAASASAIIASTIG